MSKIEQLLKRYEYVRKCWINSHTPEEEAEWFTKLEMVEKEIKHFKTARKGTSELGSSVMVKYIGLNEKQAQKNTNKQEKED